MSDVSDATEDSWFFFHVIGQDEDCRHEWLNYSIQNWDDSDDYRKFKNFTHNFDVVMTKLSSFKSILEFESDYKTFCILLITKNENYTI